MFNVVNVVSVVRSHGRSLRVRLMSSVHDIDGGKKRVGPTISSAVLLITGLA